MYRSRISRTPGRRTSIGPGRRTSIGPGRVPKFYKRQNFLLGLGIALFIALVILLIYVFSGSSDDNTTITQQETTQQETTQQETTQQATTQQATTQQATTQQATTQQETTREGTTTINPVQSDADSLDKNMITNEEIMCASCGYVGIAPNTKEDCEKCGCNWTDKQNPRCQLD
jgi:hypothetical protein